MRIANQLLIASSVFFSLPAFGPAQAKVVLRALVTEKGEVKHIIVMRSLGYEMTRRAIEAARLAKFEPAQKDKVSVPVITLIEYDFKEIAAANQHGGH